MRALPEAFAAALEATGLFTDFFVEGEPRFGAAPVVLNAEEAATLARLGERAAWVLHEAVRVCAREPALLSEFLGLSPAQRALFWASAPAWHGLARADVFRVLGGHAICEVNSDTPTGEAEAVALSAAARATAPNLEDPNAGLRARWLSMLQASVRRGLSEPDSAPRTAGLLYPTELTEDLPLVRLYTRWLESAGLDVVQGSPFNLGARDERVTLFGEPISLLVRHYKTDWWCEREPAFLGEPPPPDADALREESALLCAAQAEGRLAVVNPTASIVAQNKRLLALFFERAELFTPEVTATARALFPSTLRLETLERGRLHAEQGDWVLKSDFGCEGDEVVVGALVSSASWREALERARPGRFVVQRYFEAARDDAGDAVNLGVFVAGGQAAGFYGRAQAGPTDDRARSVPILVRPPSPAV